MTCKKCFWNRQGDSQKKHVKFLWFYFLQECDFITPTMRKLRGSILLSVQGHEKLWVFWKGTIVEPLFFWRTRAFVRSWRSTECGSDWEWPWETPTSGGCKNWMHSVQMKNLIFWGAYDGLCGEGGKTRVDLKYRYSLKVWMKEIIFTETLGKQLYRPQI